MADTQHASRPSQFTRAERRRARHEHGMLVRRSLSQVLGASLGIDMARIFGPRRGSAAVVSARHLAMYLSVVEGALTATEVASHFCRDRRSVGYGVARIEEQRDANAEVDAAVHEFSRHFRRRLDALHSYYALVGDAQGVAS